MGMRVRCGGNVIEVDRLGLVVMIAAVTGLLVVSIFSVGLVQNVGKRSNGYGVNPDDDDDDGKVEPTPIDKFLKKVMDGTGLENTADDADGDLINQEPKVVATSKASARGQRRGKTAAKESHRKRQQRVQDDNEEPADDDNDVDRPLELPIAVPVPIAPNMAVKMAMGKVSAQNAASRLKAKRQMMGLNNRPPDSRYSINVTLSDITSLDRELTDTRPKPCLDLQYDVSNLPSCTVIIPFFNEAPTMLLRAIHSVLNRSPDHLLDEIILVDDMSFDKPLKEPLESYVKYLPKVRLVRHTKRSGLIVARMIGARLAKSPVIIFLDAHTEVNVGWLEPLLDQIRSNRKQVIQPFIDGIDMRTLYYGQPGIYYKGAFSWDMRYTWLKLTDHEQKRTVETGQPYFSPTLVGCAIAVDKDYFFQMGAFDEGLRVWGGENLELAFRVWMCGGQVTTVTCSRVGHVFKQSPNKFDGTEGTKEHTVQRNLMRVVDIWLDGLRKYFYAVSLPYEYKQFKLEDWERKSVAERIKQRRGLQCRNFDWYMHNVIPEMNVPPMDARYFGEIMSLRTRACWEVTDDYYVGMTYFCFEHKIIPKNDFALTSDGYLRHGDRCVIVVAPKPFLLLGECPSAAELREHGVWSIVNQGPSYGKIQLTRHDGNGTANSWCVAQVTNIMPQHDKEQMPQLMPCRDGDPFQDWSFTYVLDFTRVNDWLEPYDA